MLKFLRQRAIEKPVFFRCIMGILALTFTIGIGWWGTTEESSSRAIATINDDFIGIEEYNRAYQNASRFYTQMMKTPFDKATLRKQILDQMVDQRLWLQESARMGLHVTDPELQKVILKLPGFQENGQFRKERYHRILEIEKITPEQFERQQRDELLIQKAKALIRDSTALTPDEIEEIEKSKPETLQQEKAGRLDQKREKAVRSYTLALKQRASIVINDERL